MKQTHRKWGKQNWLDVYIKLINLDFLLFSVFNDNDYFFRAIKVSENATLFSRDDWTALFVTFLIAAVSLSVAII